VDDESPGPRSLTQVLERAGYTVKSPTTAVMRWSCSRTTPSTWSSATTHALSFPGSICIKLVRCGIRTWSGSSSPPIRIRTRPCGSINESEVYASSASRGRLRPAHDHALCLRGRPPGTGAAALALDVRDERGRPPAQRSPEDPVGIESRAASSSPRTIARVVTAAPILHTDTRRRTPAPCTPSACFA